MTTRDHSLPTPEQKSAWKSLSLDERCHARTLPQLATDLAASELLLLDDLGCGPLRNISQKDLLVIETSFARKSIIYHERVRWLHDIMALMRRDFKYADSIDSASIRSHPIRNEEEKFSFLFDPATLPPAFLDAVFREAHDREMESNSIDSVRKEVVRYQSGKSTSEEKRIRQDQQFRMQAIKYLEGFEKITKNATAAKPEAFPFIIASSYRMKETEKAVSKAVRSISHRVNQELAQKRLRHVNQLSEDERRRIYQRSLPKDLGGVMLYFGGEQATLQRTINQYIMRAVPDSLRLSEQFTFEPSMTKNWYEENNTRTNEVFLFLRTDGRADALAAGSSNPEWIELRVTDYANLLQLEFGPNAHWRFAQERNRAEFSRTGERVRFTDTQEELLDYVRNKRVFAK